MQKSYLKHSNRMKGNEVSQLHTSTIVSSSTSLKCEQEIKKSGFFINAMINGVQCNSLLDTGATLPILSDRLYAELLNTSENELASVAHEIVDADGTPLIVQGRGPFTIKLGTQKLCCKAVVANVKVDRILGLDFLESDRCLIDVCGKRKYINGLEHKLQLYESTGCCRISLCKTTQISPKRKFECNLCGQAFNKKTVLVRHMKRLHTSREIKCTYKVPEDQPGE